MKFKVMKEASTVRYTPKKYSAHWWGIIDHNLNDGLGLMMRVGENPNYAASLDNNDNKLLLFKSKDQAQQKCDELNNQYLKESIDDNFDEAVEKESEKICCICKEPYEGYGNNADPVCSGRCCDKCNIERVIPMRFKMMNESKELNEATIEESANNYKVTYYLSTATRERRPETRADIDRDYKIDTIDVTDDIGAMMYAFMLRNNLDESDVEYEMEDYSISSIEDFVRYFDECNWSDGSVIILKVEGPSGVLYDSGHDKQSFIDVYEENERYDKEVLDKMAKEDPDTAEQFRKVLGYTESLQEAYEAEAVDLASRIMNAIDESGWSNRFVYNKGADIAIELPNNTVKTYSVSIDDEGMMTLSNERGLVLASAEVDTFIEDAVVEILGYTTEALDDDSNEVTAEVVCDDCDDDYTFEVINESISNDIVTKRFNHLYGVE